MLKRTLEKNIYRCFSKKSNSTIELDTKEKTVKKIKNGQILAELSVETAGDVLAFIRWIEVN